MTVNVFLSLMIAWRKGSLGLQEDVAKKERIHLAFPGERFETRGNVRIKVKAMHAVITGAAEVSPRVMSSSLDASRGQWGHSSHVGKTLMRSSTVSTTVT